MEVIVELIFNINIYLSRKCAVVFNVRTSSFVQKCWSMRSFYQPLMKKKRHLLVKSLRYNGCLLQPQCWSYTIYTSRKKKTSNCMKREKWTHTNTHTQDYETTHNNHKKAKMRHKRNMATQNYHTQLQHYSRDTNWEPCWTLCVCDIQYLLPLVHDCVQRPGTPLRLSSSVVPSITCCRHSYMFPTHSHLTGHTLLLRCGVLGGLFC